MEKTLGLDITIILLLIFTNCAVPFHSAETLDIGEQKFSTGYSLLNNFSIRYDVGVTGVTDFGLGLDLPLPFFPPLVFCKAKQHLLPLPPKEKGLKILAVGSGGIAILGDSGRSYYYLYGGLLGLRTGKNTLFTLGAAQLKDPRYFYDIFANEVNEEVHYTVYGGVEFKKYIMQIQYIHRKAPDYSGIINLGIGFKEK